MLEEKKPQRICRGRLSNLLKNNQMGAPDEESDGIMANLGREPAATETLIRRQDPLELSGKLLSHPIVPVGKMKPFCTRQAGRVCAL